MNLHTSKPEIFAPENDSPEIKTRNAPEIEFPETQKDTYELNIAPV